MMDLERKEKRLLYLELAQKYIFLVHVIFYATSILCDSTLTTLTSILTLGISAILLIYRVVHIKNYKSYPFFWLYVLFLISFCISIIWNLKYGWIGNMKQLIWTLIWFGGLYLFDPDREEISVDHEMNYTFLIISLLNGFFSMISTFMLLFRLLFFRKVGKKSFLIGLAKWGRLFGVYADPNYSAIICIVGIVGAFYLIRKKSDYKQKLFLKVLLILAIIFQFIYLTFSVSRTGMVVTAAVLFLMPVIYAYCSHNKIWKAALKGIIAALIVLFSEQALIFGYNHISTYLDKWSSVLFKKESIQNVQGAGELEQIGRKDELSGDISNRRFDLWKNAIQVYEEEPVFGVTFANYNSYEKVNMPHCYMLENDHTTFDAFHNVVMDVLASQGTVGFVIFAIIIFSGLIRVIKNGRMLTNQDYFRYALLLSLCLGILGSSMFLSEILYVNNAPTVIFWILWGYMIFFYGRKKNESKVMER